MTVEPALTKIAVDLEQFRLSAMNAIKSSDRQQIKFRNDFYDSKVTGHFDRDLWLRALKTSKRFEDHAPRGWSVNLYFLRGDEHLIDFVMNFSPVFFAVDNLTGSLEAQTENSNEIKQLLRSLNNEEIDNIFNQLETIRKISLLRSKLFSETDISIVKQVVNVEFNVVAMMDFDISFVDANLFEVDESIETLRFVGLQLELTVSWFMHRSISSTLLVERIVRAVATLSNSNRQKLLKDFPSDRAALLGLTALLTDQMDRVYNFRHFSHIPIPLIWALWKLKHELLSEVSEEKQLRENLIQNLWFLHPLGLLFCCLAGCCQRLYDIARTITSWGILPTQNKPDH